MRTPDPPRAPTLVTDGGHDDVALDQSIPGDFDAVELEIVRTQLESIAEEMGTVLVQGAFSPNITERRDCSTALFDAQGRMVAQAEHVPVHLGAMPDAVTAVLDCDPDLGDVFVLNDPFEGGTHLPDITLVSPIGSEDRIVSYAVARAHHADIGGRVAGSMPAGAREIYEEGVRIPPVRYIAEGEINSDVEALLLANVRNPDQRRADLRAQRGAIELASRRLGDLFEWYGATLLDAFEAVMAYSRQRVEAELREFPDGSYCASDALEGDGASADDIPIEVTVTVDGATLDVDFAGTADQVAGNVNAPLSVAKSAVYYVLRCVTDPDVPPNQGCYDPLTVRAPEGSLLDPARPAAVVGGNVETSQRVADVVFAALEGAIPARVPAGGQGTMNNVVLGNPDFTYYETIGGGAGATATSDGLSGVQVGMTNTLNTPIEALESAYPILVECYSLRDGTGGSGEYVGGDGLIRALTVEDDATISLLTDRRRHRPRGLAGGAAGATGQNLVDGTEVGSKVTFDVEAGTTIRIETPGGGGYEPPDSDPLDEDS